jgi:hypothetical protein
VLAENPVKNRTFQHSPGRGAMMSNGLANRRLQPLGPVSI